MTPATACTTVAVMFMLLAAIFVAPHLDWPSARIASLSCIVFGSAFWFLSWRL